MREMTQNLLRGLCLAAVLSAGSCTVPFTKDADNFDDPAANHPLLVEPSYQSVKLSYASGTLNPGDASKLDAFISDYRQHGNGKIAISVPGGPGMAQIATSLAGQINEMGVGRDHILIASRDAAGDTSVELNYISYQAHAEPCGDWSENLAFTADNRTAANFGCSNQHNLAAMVSDPRDLLGPRPMDGGNAVRRQAVIGNYEAGKSTGSQKSPDQKASISDIGN
ncbi:MAG TPA: CpaD family pilus assembly protein [Rhizomicrobium sp.]|jgi:pilus assembly protein CpaD